MNNLYVIELTVGYESNTVANGTRKAKKYEHRLNDSDLKRSHRKICFVNLVMTAIGIYSKHSEEFFKMLKDLNIDNTAATYIYFYKANRNLYTLVLLYFLYENKGVDTAGSNELLS